MAVRTLPSARKFRAIEWRLDQPAQVNRSAYTGGRKVMSIGTGRWSATIEFVPFKDDAAVRAWRGFLASLEGPVHTFYLPVLGAQHAGSNPTATISAGASSGTLSSSIGLKAGQYMTFTLTSGKRQMVILTADMSGGNVSFRPPLREGTTGTVETKAPYAQMALTAEQVAWLSRPGRMFDLSPIDVEEAF